MKCNEYDSAEVFQMGSATELILGQKTTQVDIDSSGGEPMDRHYMAFTSIDT